MRPAPYKGYSVFKNNLAAGRMEAATNPYYAGAPRAATAGWTRTRYDAVDRG